MKREVVTPEDLQARKIRPYAGGVILIGAVSLLVALAAVPVAAALVAFL